MMAAMMAAWRIEHPKDGLGPYREDGPKIEMNCTDRTPCHGRAGVLTAWQSVPPNCLRYACESIEQLCEWFIVAERRRCAEAGYIMALYHVKPEAWVPGEKHVCFDVTRAERVETHPIPLRVRRLDMTFEFFKTHTASMISDETIHWLWEGSEKTLGLRDRFADKPDDETAALILRTIARSFVRAFPGYARVREQ